MNLNKVILIGGDHYNGLSLVRLFGRKGLQPYGIISGITSSNGFLRESKYWKKVWTVPDDSYIIGVLRDNFNNETIKPVIIPWSDGAASEIDIHLELLEKHFIVPSIGKKPSLVYQMMDKYKQVEMAHTCGLQIADSYEIFLDQRLSYDFGKITYPCIGKPIISCEGDKRDIKKIDSPSELSSYLDDLKTKGYHRILLQEYVEIEKEFDIEGFICGKDFAYFVSEKIRTWPDIGGPTAFAVSVNNPLVNAEVDKLVKYLQYIEYSGLFDIELFKVGSRYLLNEMNWRNSAVCFAALYSGVEYPLYWYYSMTGHEYVINSPHEYGIYSMVEFLDFQRVRHKEISLPAWVKDLYRSKARAYYDKSDLAPLKKRFSLYLHKSISRGASNVD